MYLVPLGATAWHEHLSPLLPRRDAAIMDIKLQLVDLFELFLQWL